MAGGEGPWDPSKGKYLKVAAAFKHLTAYSREQGRMSDNYNLSDYDLSDTYLAAFANGISHNPGSGFMCSYTSVK
jgi:beta-glucosidase-like glycosyl hydrolase